MNKDVRRHPRYGIKGGMLVVLSVSVDNGSTAAEILDMSENGLALMHDDELAAVPDKAEILLIGPETSNESLLKIFASLIYQKKLEQGFRSGFEFIDLSRDETSWLQNFIKRNIKRNIESQES